MTKPTLREAAQAVVEADDAQRLDQRLIEQLRSALSETQAVASGEPVACGNCGGSGRMVRDPDIGTDQECFVCEGSGSYSDTAPPPQAVREPREMTQLEYARLQAISLDYSDSEDECTGFRDGWRSAEKHHGITKGGQHG